MVGVLWGHDRRFTGLVEVTRIDRLFPRTEQTLQWPARSSLHGLKESRMARQRQGSLFPDIPTADRLADGSCSTFVPNMSLPVHRWFRYSAGFSAEWVERVISEAKLSGQVQVLDPFAGSATTLIAAEGEGIASYGLEAH